MVFLPSTAARQTCYTCFSIAKHGRKLKIAFVGGMGYDKDNKVIKRGGSKVLSPKLFDHTILKPEATKEAVKKVCMEAVKYGFASVCVNEYYTAFAAKLLEGSGVKVCTVVGFPLGMTSTAVKCFEAGCAVNEGANEVDMVINVGALKDGCDDYVSDEIAAVKAACGKNVLLKVIIETCLLSDEEKVRACRLAVEAGADFVKTSTGFSTGGATAGDVALMRRTVGDRAGVKASGGIREAKTARTMADAGANRLTSAAVKIVEGGNSSARSAHLLR